MYWKQCSQIKCDGMKRINCMEWIKSVFWTLDCKYRSVLPAVFRPAEKASLTLTTHQWVVVVVGKQTQKQTYILFATKRMTMQCFNYCTWLTDLVTALKRVISKNKAKTFLQTRTLISDEHSHSHASTLVFLTVMTSEAFSSCVSLFAMTSTLSSAQQHTPTHSLLHRMSKIGLYAVDTNVS